MQNKQKDGEWGIFSSIQSLPKERFDPFSTYIDSKGVNIGHKTIFSPIRLQRPIEGESKTTKGEFKDASPTPDTFCKLVSGTLPSIVISKDLTVIGDPFTAKTTENNLQSSTAITLINKYPPIARIVSNQAKSMDDLTNLPTGLSLIHLFTKHYYLPEQVPIDDWERFFHNYRVTMQACLDHQLILESKKIGVFTFFNIGALAGASIPHLHGQTVIQLTRTDLGIKRSAFWKSSKFHQKNCVKCQLWKVEKENILAKKLLINQRLISQNTNWMAFLAYAPEKDSHIRLVPKRHLPSLWSLNHKEITSLSEIFVKSNRLLTKFVRKEGKSLQLDLDRNVIFRQFHTNEKSHFHMFIDILPIQKLGGAEMSDSQKLSSVYPENLALKIRSYAEDISNR